MQILASKREHIALMLILILALALRLHGIDWGLPSESHPHYTYHPDEWISGIWATQLYSGTILDVHFEYGGTLYMSFLYACFKISTLFSDFIPGHNSFAKYILFTRVTLVAVSLLSVYLIYAVGLKLYNRQFALLAALLLAVTPAHVIWTQRVRVDELACLLALLIFYLSITVFQQRTVPLRYWAFIGIIVGASIALRAPFVLFSATPFIALFLSPIKLSTWYSGISLKLVSIYAASVILAYICFSPHSLLYLDHFINGLLLQKKYQSTVFVDSVGLGPIWWQFQRYMLPQALGWPFYILFLSALIGLLRIRDSRCLFIAFSALPYLLLTAVGTWVVVRYTIPLLPFIILICVAFLHHLQSIPKFKKFVLPGTALLVTLTISFLLPYQSLHTEENIRDSIGRWMAEELPSDAKVLTLRSYGNDMTYEPIIPKTMHHEFVRHPKRMQCDYCYRNWIYEYVIISDPLLHNLDRLKSQYPHAEMIQYYKWIKDTHELVKEFDVSPTWFGINIQAMYNSNDLNFVSPTYRIYRRLN